jgi:hypothetical protein
VSIQLLPFLLSLVTPCAAQLPGEPAPAAGAAPRHLVLEGLVVDAEGAPAGGAVIVTSAGGQTVAGRGGAFRLALALPGDVLELNVTAVRTVGVATQAGSRRVTIQGAWDVLAVGTLALSSGGCQPAWLPTFGAYTDLNEPAYALAAFDDGHGPALYAGGSFSGYAARLEGTRWVPLGSLDGAVFAFAVFDDGLGGGPALYAGGVFQNADGIPVRSVARWDGRAWSALGTVIPGGTPTVTALAVYDDGQGQGPALYIAGSFGRLADGTLSKNVGRWSKHGWAAVGALEGRGLNDLAVFDDGLGGGPRLFGLETYIRGGEPR